MQRTSDTPGFVLVGVVIMVLALTILGLSLFSLSSYEAQFLNRSLDETQTFHYAQGGLDRARVVLAANGTLGSVKNNLPPGVIWMRATQVQGTEIDSTGAIVWDGEDIWIDVLAKYQGVSRHLRASYHPNQMVSNYARLISSKVFRVNETFGGTDRKHSIYLGASVWHSETWQGLVSDTLIWYPIVGSHTVPSTQEDPGPPIPDAVSFVENHWSEATEPTPSGPSTSRLYPLVGNTSEVTYFKWEDRGPTFGLFETGDVTVEVTGRCVWLFKKGFKFEGPVTVRRPSTYSGVSSLVIVSEPNGREPFHPEAGVWFWGGLQSPDVDLVLVSNGGVQIEQINNFNQNYTVERLAVFAERVLMTGPYNGQHWVLRHPPSMDGEIDWLAANGALPNSVGAGSLFAFIPGTWGEVPTP